MIDRSTRLVLCGGVILLSGMNLAPPSEISVEVRERDEIVVAIDVRDAALPDAEPPVTALTVDVDGRPAQDVLIVPGSGQTRYETLVGPLPAGRHTVAVRRSARWPWNDAIHAAGVAARTVSPGSPDYDLLRLAPVVVLRPDTVGVLNDLPMILYAEDRRSSGAARVGYTTIFTNEDGGTETRALFARWGRACDIELIYEAVLDGAGGIVTDTYQGPDHKVLPFKGRRIGDHPVLVVATRNNMVSDSAPPERPGDTASVMLRPVPVFVKPDAGTREAILDVRPWLHRLTFRELRREGKAFDPRDHVYLEARLRLVDAAVAAWVTLADGGKASSDLGEPKLRVERDGWVRVAVPTPRDARVTAAGWTCFDRERPRKVCEVTPAKIFRLADDFSVQPVAVQVTP
jgi:hypothetical protein